MDAFDQDVVIDLADGSIKPEGVSLFPWVQMKPEVPDGYPDQLWLLRGWDAVCPGVNLVIAGSKSLTRIDLGLVLHDSRKGYFRCDLEFGAAQARYLAQALLSAAALYEERMAAQEGGAA